MCVPLENWETKCAKRKYLMGTICSVSGCCCCRRFFHAEKVRFCWKICRMNGHQKVNHIFFSPSSSSFISLNFKMAFTLRNGQLCFYVFFFKSSFVSREWSRVEKRREEKKIDCSSADKAWIAVKHWICFKNKRLNWSQLWKFMAWV